MASEETPQSLRGMICSRPCCQPRDDPEFRLVVEDVGLGKLRQCDGIAGADNGVRVFEEHVQGTGLILSVGRLV